MYPPTTLFDGKTTLLINSGRRTEPLPKIKAPKSNIALSKAERTQVTWLFRQAWREAQASHDTQASIIFAQAWRRSLTSKASKLNRNNCTPADWNLAIDYLFDAECIRNPDPLFTPTEEIP